MARPTVTDVDPSILEIDVDNLQEEWVGQPALYFKYAKLLADARDSYERHKAEIDVTRAEIDEVIRQDPEEFGLEKITETAVKMAIEGHPEYKEVVELALKAKHKVDIFQAATAALDHRKRALEKLVDMEVSMFYAEPKAAEHSREAVRESTKRSVKKRGQFKRERNGDD